MNRALWRKAAADAWLHLLLSCLGLVLFGWVFVWLMGFMQTGRFQKLLEWMPGFVERMIGMDLALLASPTGRLSVLFVHVVTTLICVGWAVGRGSNPISGEIGRGTMDLIISLPLRRASILVPPAIVATIGAGCLAFSVLGGIALGIATVPLEQPVSLPDFLPGVLNLFSMVFCVTGMTMCFSSLVYDRWKVIGMTVGVFIVSVITKMAGRLVPDDYWLDNRLLLYSSFLTAFEPQRLILMPNRTDDLVYNGALLGIGLACFLLAGLFLTYRDIPAAR